MWGVDRGQCSPSEIRKLVYYNFWNKELQEMIEELGEQKKVSD